MSNRPRSDTNIRRTRRAVLEAASVAGGVGVSLLADTGKGAVGPTSEATGQTQEDAPAMEAKLLQVASRCAATGDANTVTAEFDADWNVVMVRGTLIAKNPCQVAEIIEQDTTSDSGREKHEVVVSTSEPEDGGICAQCTGAIRYMMALVFDDTLPGSDDVRIIHEGQDQRVVVYPPENEPTTTANG